MAQAYRVIPISGFVGRHSICRPISRGRRRTDCASPMPGRSGGSRTSGQKFSRIFALPKPRPATCTGGDRGRGGLAGGGPRYSNGGWRCRQSPLARLMVRSAPFGRRPLPLLLRGGASSGPSRPSLHPPVPVCAPYPIGGCRPTFRSGGCASAGTRFALHPYPSRWGEPWKRGLAMRWSWNGADF